MSTRCMRRAGFLAVFFVLVASCSVQEPSPEIIVTPNPIPAPPPSVAREQLDRLEKVIGERKARREAVLDVIAMLNARDHEAKEEWDLAVQSWLEALRKAEGRFGREAFVGWTNAYAKILGKRADTKEMAKVLLAETKNGQQSPYLMARGLFRHEQLEIELAKSLGTIEPQEDSQEVYVPKKGFPTDDPLLNRAAKSYCSSKNQAQRAMWQEWTASLDRPLLDFWRAKIATCDREYDHAINLFKNVIPTLSKNPKTATLGVNATENLVALYRAKGERELAADAYIILMKAFEKPGVTAESYGESKIEFMVRRIESTLWTARYRAMVGDFTNAKNYVQQTFDLISKAYVDHPYLPARYRDQLAEAKAEGYHILAFRVALEQKDYAAALSFNRLGQQVPNLKVEWKNRFNWFGGIYEYLGGNKEEALKRWEAMLTGLQGDSLKPQLYFWMARLYGEMKDDVKAEFYYRLLQEKHPLHFYSIVAPTLARMQSNHQLEDMFGSAPEIGQELLAAKDYDLGKWKRHKKVGPALFRAELLVAAQVNDFAPLAVRDLGIEARRTFRVKSFHSAFVYLSRLQYLSGEFSSAIALTGELSDQVEEFWKKYPEQLFIGYPRPYADIYERYATKNYLDREILYSISRQESRFIANAKSPAGAYGVMQLIPVTAERFALEEKIDLKPSIEQKLQEAETNIRLGSSYLRFLNRYYKGELAPVAGAYNAGEYVVDGWVSRRASEDLLLWIELIPFGETKNYVKAVLRNHQVYKFINNSVEKLAQKKKQAEEAASAQ